MTNLEFSSKNFEAFIAGKENAYVQYLIIPGSGCEGCISNAEQYVIDNAKNQTEAMLFIFTNIASKKILKLSLGQDIISLPNIMLDSLSTLHFRSIYPIIVEKSPNGTWKSKEIKMKDIASLSQ